MQAERSEATVAELIDYIGPGLLAERQCPCWPPDVFALAASVLRRSGAYVRVLDLPPRKEEDLLGKHWPERARWLGEQWRRALNDGLEREGWNPEDRVLRARIPRPVQAAWSRIRRYAHKTPLAEVLGNEDLCRALLLLCLVADETSSGIGVDVYEQDAFLEFAWEVLPDNNLSSLCLQIDPERVRVLPKQHTSQRGITIRSLSHHLSLCPASEVDVFWNSPYDLETPKELDVINLLLLPWPLELTPKDFAPCEGTHRPWMAEPYRLFSFRRRPADNSVDELRTYMDAALRKAREAVERIDGIIFPELALTFREFVAAEQIAASSSALLIAGVNGQEGDPGFAGPTNTCVVQPAGLTRIPSDRDQFSSFLRVWQGKHHRWCLDRRQIIQYGLGGILPASKNCWEATEVGSRGLNFITLGAWLTLSVLICEDLARQDPVAEVIRSVGPNLVIALLMDGPQLRSRWPSRYASVLADDPGSSVLTFTSLGMASRSRPATATEPDRSRTIALWRDVRYGEQEIELPKGHNACVLSLVCESLEEFTADGRGDGRQSHFPVFAGLHTFHAGSKLAHGSAGALP